MESSWSYLNQSALLLLSTPVEATRTTDTVYEKIPIENAGQIAMLVTATASIFIPTILVVLRFVAQRKLRTLNGSDYCITAALLFLYGLCILDFIMVLKGGFTFDSEEIVSEYGREALVVFLKCMAAYPIIWNSCVLTSKLSVLMMYTTLMPVRKMIVAVRVVGAFVIVYNIGAILGAFLICQPLSMYWDPAIHGHCGDVKLYYEFLGAVNVISDVVILIVPLPVVCSLQLATKKKVGLIAMFCIGFLTCVVTIYRQAVLPEMNNLDVPGTALLAYLFTTAEVAVAISLACVPLLRPLFKRSSRPRNADDCLWKSTRSLRSWGFNELEDDSAPPTIGYSVRKNQNGRWRPKHGRTETAASFNTLGEIKIEKTWTVESIDLDMASIASMDANYGAGVSSKIGQ